MKLTWNHARCAALSLCVALSGLLAGPGGDVAGPPPPERLAKGAPELDALYELCTVGGREMYVPIPPAKVIETLRNGSEPWKKALLARTLERTGQSAEAEAAWKEYATVAPTPLEGATRLADFYHRHHQPRKELEALRQAVSSVAPEAAGPPDAATVWSRILNLAGLRNDEVNDPGETAVLAAEGGNPPVAQEPTPEAGTGEWAESEQASVSEEETAAEGETPAAAGGGGITYPHASGKDVGFGFTPAERAEFLRLRSEHFKGRPEEAGFARAWLYYLAESGQKEALEKGLALHAQRFPKEGDTRFAVRAKALATGKRRADLEAFLNREYRPLLNEGALRIAFSALETAGGWLSFVAQAEARLRQNPLDLDATTRLYHALAYRGDVEKAGRVLRDYRVLRSARLGAGQGSPWKPDELAILGSLAYRAKDYPEALRHFAAFYRQVPARQSVPLPGDGKAMVREEALRAAFLVLVSHSPESASREGESLEGWGTFLDVDPDPGFLQAAISVFLNGEDGPGALQEMEAHAGEYFVLRRATEVLEQLKPLVQPEEYPAMKVRLAALTTRYRGEKAGRRVLVEAAEASSVPRFRRAILLQAAESAKGAEDLAAAENLLRRAVREESAGAAAPVSREALSYWLAPEVESGWDDRWRGLDALVTFLKTQNRLPDAVGALREEIVAHPRDEALFEKLAALLEESGPDATREEHYRQAISRFDKPGWFEKLARLYLKQQRLSEFLDVSRRAVGALEGTGIEEYLRPVLSQAAQGRDDNAFHRMALEIYRAALDRFPLDERFIAHVLEEERHLKDPAYPRTLARYCMVSPSAREGYFQHLSSSSLLGALDQEDVSRDPALMYLKAESLVWRCRFEEATPLYRELANVWPDREDVVDRAAGLLQSAGLENPTLRTEAANLLARTGRALGKEELYLARAGDCLALAGDMDPALPLWKEILQVYPSDPSVWRGVATIYWDYYRYGDALETLRTIRRTTGDPKLYAFETGALLECLDRHDEAMGEYLSLATTWQDRSWEALNRLERLLSRPPLRAQFGRMVEERIGKEGAPGFLGGLRNFLEERNLASSFPVKEWCLRQVEAAPTSDELQKTIGALGAAIGTEGSLRGYRRLVEMAPPGVERILAAFSLATRLQEAGKDLEAENVILSLVKENPMNLGVVRRAATQLRQAGRTEAAASVLRSACERAVPAYHREFILAEADTFLEGRRYQDAMKAADRWLAANPADLEVRSRKWDALAALDDSRGLVSEYRDALATIPAREPDPAARKKKVDEIRQRLIPAALAMGDPTLALDQYIELLKGSPEDRDLLDRAWVVASRHNLGDRLEGFCRKSAQASSADYRWPLILARLAMAKDDYAGALASYEACRKIVPHRTDLLAEGARALEASGDLNGLRARYVELARLEYRNPVWLRMAALTAWRAHDEAGAKDLLEQYLQALATNRSGQVQERVAVYSIWHRYDWATEELLALVREASSKPELLDVLGSSNAFEVAMKAGKAPLLLATVLDTGLEAGDKGAPFLSAASTETRKILHLPMSAEVRAELEGTLLSHLEPWLAGDDGKIAADFFGSLANDAVLPRLMVRMASHRMSLEDPQQIINSTERTMARHGLWPEMLTLCDQALKRSDLSPEIRQFLRIRRAWLFYMLGASNDERLALSSLAASDANALARYIHVLIRTGKLQELDQLLARPAQGESDAALMALVAEKDWARAASALHTQFPKRTQAWIEAHLARLGQASGGKLPVVPHATAALHVATIGELVAWQPDRGAALFPPAWHDEAASYGEWLARQPEGTGTDLGFMLAPLERNLQRRQDYEEVFHAALRAGKLSLAKDCATWAEELKKRPMGDNLARIRLADAAGDKATVAREYVSLLNRMAEKREDGFLFREGPWLLDLGRRENLLVQTGPRWLTVLSRSLLDGSQWWVERMDYQDALDPERWTSRFGGEAGDLFVLWASFLPPESRAALLSDFLEQGKAPAAAFLVQSGLAEGNSLVAAIKVLAGGKDLLSLSARVWLAGHATGAPRPPVGVLVSDGRLRPVLSSLQGGDITLVSGFLDRWRTTGRKPTLASIREMSVGLPGGMAKWEDFLAGLLNEWGAPAEAAKLRLSLLEERLASKAPTDEDLFSLGQLREEAGDPAAATEAFRRAVVRASDPLSLSQRIRDFLVRRPAAEAHASLLTVLDRLDPGAAATEWFRLRFRLVGIGRPAGPEDVQALLAREDLPFDARCDLAEAAAAKAEREKEWGAALLAALRSHPSQREVDVLLESRLAALQGGLESGVNTAAAYVKTHGGAYSLAHWVEEAASSAGKASLAAPVALTLCREPGEGAVRDLRILRVMAEAGRIRQALSMLEPEILDYQRQACRDGIGARADEEQRDCDQSPGRLLAPLLAVSDRVPTDLALMTRLLEKNGFGEPALADALVVAMGRGDAQIRADASRRLLADHLGKNAALRPRPFRLDFSLNE